jgi:hypothetical protein
MASQKTVTAVKRRKVEVTRNDLKLPHIPAVFINCIYIQYIVIRLTLQVNYAKCFGLFFRSPSSLNLRTLLQYLQLQIRERTRPLLALCLNILLCIIL